jgi:hypothetical protein
MNQDVALTIPREATAAPFVLASSIVSDQTATRQATRARVECQA